jgi:predicted RNA-binding protein with PUA-like domain
MNYWLMKSEPGCYSIDDLQRDGSTFWDGVRNYQARNMMRDQIKKGDQVLFYHSNATPPGIVGIAKVIKEGYPDHTAFDPDSDHPDLATTPDDPRWYMVDIAFVKKFDHLIALNELKQHPELSGMQLLKKGNRLSVMPVSADHWQTIMAMGR